MNTTTVPTVPTAPATPGVRLRELGPGEHDVLQAVFDGLSPLSRQRRFHAAVPRLGPALRDRLAAVDGRRHLAVAAFAGAAPIGIARLIDEGGGRAELAVEVVDAWQGRGIGKRLVRAVADRGRELGLTELVADALADNIAVPLVLLSVFGDVTWSEDGPETTYLVGLEPVTGTRAA